MLPTEADLLAARFARMKALIETLENTCGETTELRAAFLKLKLEMEATRLSLRPVIKLP